MALAIFGEILVSSFKETCEKENFMTKKRQRHLLVIGGGVFQVPAIKVAKSMGLKVVVTDYNVDAEGMLIADYPIEVSTQIGRASCRERV